SEGAEGPRRDVRPGGGREHGGAGELRRRRPRREPDPLRPARVMGGRPSTFDPARTYAFLEDEGGAVVLPGGAEFWSALAAGPPFPPDVGRVVSGSGWLAALYALDVDGAAWERHPNGAELLLMVTGEMDL